MIKPERKDVLRYLGFRGAEPDGETLKMIESAEEKLCASVTPRTLSRRFKCRVGEDGVTFGGYFFKSKKLSSHLSGCEEIFLTAVTLGAEADNLLRRASITDMGGAAVMQAVSAALTESVFNALCESLEKELAGQSLFLKPGFSPGYSDFNIKYQREIFELLDCSRRIGLSLSDSYMMVPTKSITSIVGITSQRQCVRSKCKLCPKADCEFREV